MIKLGEKIREARKRKNFSLRELASKADVSASLLSQIENSKTNPSVRSLYNIAEALDLPVDFLFQESPKFPSSPAEGNIVSEQTASDFRDRQVVQESKTSPENLQAEGPETRSVPLVRADQRTTIELKGGVTWGRLTGSLEKDAEFLEVTYQPGATSGNRMSHHTGREFGVILEGELLIELGFEKYSLQVGDSIIFDSITPHRLTNNGETPMRAYWVILGPI